MADAFFTRAPSTIVTIPLTGQLEFTIPFEFLARKFVVVTLLGTDRKVLTMNIDYRFIAVNKIRLERQPEGSYTRIELRRYTSATDRLVTFIDGSILRATDLNLAQVQTMHVAEEARDMTSDNIGVNDEGDLDARNRKIVNLADGENPLDAVNLGQLRQFDTSTGNNADKAAISAAEAKESEMNAAGSEARCVVAEAKAISSAGTAMTAAADANRSKVAAKHSADTVVPLVPIVEKAASDAAQAAIDAVQAVQDVKDLGAVPVGTIVMFGNQIIPAGFLSLMSDSPTFNVTEYPDLAKLYPNGQLPSYKDRVPEGIGSGITLGQKRAGNVGLTTTMTLVASAVADHVHSAWTDQQGAHSHDYSTLAPTGSPHAIQDGGLMWGEQSRATTVAGAHGHNIGMHGAGGHNHTVTGSIGSGKNLVDATGTIFAIKAAGHVSDEGLMEVVAIKQDVESLKTSKVDKANPEFTGDMTLGGSFRIGGALVVGQGSNSKISTTSFGESSAGNWASKTSHQWHTGGVDVGAIRGLSTDCKGLYRTRSGDKSLDYLQDPTTGNHSFKNTLGQDALIVRPNGDLQMQWGGLLSNQFTLRAPKRWALVDLGSVPVQDNATLQLPHDVRGLRGLFRYIGQYGDTVYQTFTFPPIDCRFQLNRKSNWQIFELMNNGTTLIRRYGWDEGDAPYIFYSENPTA